MSASVILAMLSVGTLRSTIRLPIFVVLVLPALSSAVTFIANEEVVFAFPGILAFATVTVYVFATPVLAATVAETVPIFTTGVIRPEAVAVPFLSCTVKSNVKSLLAFVYSFPARYPISGPSVSTCTVHVTLADSW